MNLKPSKKMWPIYLAAFTAIGAILAVVAAYYQFTEAEEANKKANEWNRKFVNSQAALIEAQTETIKLVTGAGFIIVEPHDSDSENIILGFRNNTKYPVFDSSTAFINYDKLNVKRFIERDRWIEYSDEDYVSSLANGPQVNFSGFSTLNADYKTPIINGIYFRLFRINSRHNVTLQYTIIEVIDRRFNYSYKIFQWDVATSTQTLIHEQQQGNYNEEIWMKNFHSFKEIRPWTGELPSE